MAAEEVTDVLEGPADAQILSLRVAAVRPNELLEDQVGAAP